MRGPQDRSLRSPTCYKTRKKAVTVEFKKHQLGQNLKYHSHEVFHINIKLIPWLVMSKTLEKSIAINLESPISAITLFSFMFLSLKTLSKLTVLEKNQTVVQGSKTTFSCPVDGIPKPNITWYRGSDISGMPIFIGEKLEARDTGCYTCVASNSPGTSINITQCLTVGKPFFI